MDELDKCHATVTNSLKKGQGRAGNEGSKFSDRNGGRWSSTARSVSHSIKKPQSSLHDNKSNLNSGANNSKKHLSKKKRVVAPGDNPEIRYHPYLPGGKSPGGIRTDRKSGNEMVSEKNNLQSKNKGRVELEIGLDRASIGDNTRVDKFPNFEIFEKEATCTAVNNARVPESVQIGSGNQISESIEELGGHEEIMKLFNDLEALEKSTIIGTLRFDSVSRSTKIGDVVESGMIVTDNNNRGDSNSDKSEAAPITTAPDKKLNSDTTVKDLEGSALFCLLEYEKIGMTPLNHAIISANKHQTDRDYNFHPRIRDSNGSLILAKALAFLRQAYRECPEITKKHLNCADRHDNTALNYAVLTGAGSGICEILIECGADIKQETNMTVFHDIFRTLDILGTEIKKDCYNYLKAIIDKIEKQADGISDLLVVINKIKPIKIPGSSESIGITPLIMALQKKCEGQQEIIRLLLNHKASPNIPDSSGCPALLYAIKLKNSPSDKISGITKLIASQTDYALIKMAYDSFDTDPMLKNWDQKEQYKQYLDSLMEKKIVADICHPSPHPRSVQDVLFTTPLPQTLYLPDCFAVDK